MAQPLPPPYTSHLPRRGLRLLRSCHLNPRSPLRSRSGISASSGRNREMDGTLLLLQSSLLLLRC
jgi:hypothetical protein